MTLVAHVDRGAAGVSCRFSCCDEGVQAGRRAPAGQEPSRTVGITDPAAEPFQDHQLELAGTARGQPGALVDVIPGGHEVGHHARPGGRRRDEPEETRVIDTRRHREDFSGGPFNDLQCRQTGLGGIFQELVDQLLPEFSVPGAFFRQGLDSLHDELRRPAGQLEHGSGGHPESVLFSIEISRNGFLIALHRNLLPFQNIVESGNIKCNKGGVNRRMRRYRHRGIAGLGEKLPQAVESFRWGFLMD